MKAVSVERTRLFFSSFVVHWWVHFPSSFPHVSTSLAVTRFFFFLDVMYTGATYSMYVDDILQSWSHWQHQRPCLPDFQTSIAVPIKNFLPAYTQLVWSYQLRNCYERFSSLYPPPPPPPRGVGGGGLYIGITVSVCPAMRVSDFFSRTISPEPLDCCVWRCISIMMSITEKKKWFAFFLVKVTARAYIIKI